MKVNFHNYDHQLEIGLEKLENAEMSPGNKDLVYEFFSYLQSTDISTARLVKYLQVMREIDSILGKPFKEVKEVDVVRYVNVINSRDYSVWTKQVYKVILKRFYKWLYQTKTFPELVEWITINVKRKDIPLPTENDLVSDEEIQKMLSCCKTIRDRAFLSVLAESGARIGEMRM